MTHPLININPLEKGEIYQLMEGMEQTVPWTAPGLRVTRFRLLGDPGYPYLDVSYCFGELPSGEKVRVQVPFRDLPKRGWKRALVQHAIKDGVHAVRMGMIENASILI